MDIHEYQANHILATFVVGVPPGALAYSPEQQHIELESLVAIHGS